MEDSIDLKRVNAIFEVRIYRHIKQFDLLLMLELPLLALVSIRSIISHNYAPLEANVTHSKRQINRAAKIRTGISSERQTDQAPHFVGSDLGCILL